MTVKVIWSPTALRQVAHIYDYLEAFHPLAANQVAAELVAAGDSLERFHEEWKRSKPFVWRAISSA